MNIRKKKNNCNAVAYYRNFVILRNTFIVPETYLISI